MRVVNMAHGSLYLVAAYVAIDVQRRIITGDPDTTVSSTQVSVLNWFVVLLVAALVAGLLGLADAAGASCAGTRARTCARR